MRSAARSTGTASITGARSSDSTSPRSSTRCAAQIRYLPARSSSSTAARARQARCCSRPTRTRSASHQERTGRARAALRRTGVVARVRRAEGIARILAAARPRAQGRAGLDAVRGRQRDRARRGAGRRRRWIYQILKPDSTLPPASSRRRVRGDAAARRSARLSARTRAPGSRRRGCAAGSRCAQAVPRPPPGAPLGVPSPRRGARRVACAAAAPSVPRGAGARTGAGAIAGGLAAVGGGRRPVAAPFLAAARRAAGRAARRDGRRRDRRRARRGCRARRGPPGPAEPAPLARGHGDFGEQVLASAARAAGCGRCSPRCRAATAT